MFACICHAVTCDEIHAAVDDGAVTVEEVGEITLAGTGCGTCQQRLETMIGERARHCPLAALRVA